MTTCQHTPKRLDTFSLVHDIPHGVANVVTTTYECQVCKVVWQTTETETILFSELEQEREQCHQSR